MGSGLLRRPWALATAVLGFAMVATYIGLIVAQGGDSFGEVLAWALLMSIPAVAALAAVEIEDLRIARRLLGAAAVLFLVVGAVSIFSVGIGFLLIAALAAVAAVRLSNPGQG
jgi:hypothetical protein